jgi:8-oxo-dGTP diphosphatase
MAQDFNGAKVALFIGDKLLVILRDDNPAIAFPNLWDFPGGGREGHETPFDTLAREVQEEVGLVLPRTAILWATCLPWSQDAAQNVWFYVAQLPAYAQDNIIFGDEGQRWALMTPAEFLGQSQTVPNLGDRLLLWLGQQE